MPLIFVTPAEGLLVPDPVLGDFLPPEGRTVERDAHWIRRERDLEATVSEPPAAPEPTPAAAAAEDAPEAAFVPPADDSEGQA